MDTAKAILEVAYKYFVEKGYEATNIREICEDVGIKMPSLYYHFKSKENLFYEAYDEYSSRYLDQYEKLEIIHENIDAELKLFALFKEDMEYVISNKTHFRFHVRYKFFPPEELYDELQKKEKMYSERRENVIMKVVQEGIQEGIFDENKSALFLKLYTKFVFDNMIGIVFFDNGMEDSIQDASWKSLMNCIKI